MDHDRSHDESLDPAAGLAIIAAQRGLVRDTAEVDGPYLFVVWGASWLVGYAPMWVSAWRDPAHEASVPAVVTLAACLLAGIVLTLVHVVRRSVGLRGTRATAGAMYGWSWLLGFTLMGVLLAALGRAGASAEVMSLASNGLACLIVGLLYMAGGALWRERAQFVLGVWMLVVAAVASLAGIPTTYLVMALAGGGGFLVCAVVAFGQRRRHRAGLSVVDMSVGAA